MAAIAPWRFLLALALVLVSSSPLRAENSPSHSVRVPRDIVLVLDNSGSMRKNDRNFAMKHAAGEFIKNAPPNSHIGIVIFDSNVKYAFHLAPAAGPTQETLLASLQQLDYRGRWTNIPAALNQAVDELKTNSRDGATRTVVLLTDGVVETGDTNKDRAAAEGLRQTLIPDAEGHHIKIYSVALGPNSDTELLQALSNRTSGDYFWASIGDELPALFTRIVGTIAETGPTTAPESQVPEATGAPAKVEVPKAEPTPVAVAPAPQERVAPNPQDKNEVPSLSGATEDRSTSTARTTDGGRSGSVAEDADSERPALPEYREPAAAKPNTQKQKNSNGARSKGETDWWLDGLGGLLILTVGLLGWMIARSRNTVLRGPMERHSVMARTGGGDNGQSPQAYLHDLSGVTGRQRHEISNAITLIGRVAPNPEDRLGSIVIDRPTIGRRHAVIERKHYGFWLIDQHSKNGTYVNEYRVTDEVCLTHGDRVRFHEYDFEFVLAGLGLADETISVGELILLNNRGSDTRTTTRGAQQVDITSPDDPTQSGQIKSGSNKGG